MLSYIKGRFVISTIVSYEPTMPQTCAFLLNGTNNAYIAGNAIKLRENFLKTVHHLRATATARLRHVVPGP